MAQVRVRVRVRVVSARRTLVQFVAASVCPRCSRRSLRISQEVAGPP
jgi:hypothetical protein